MNGAFAAYGKIDELMEAETQDEKTNNQKAVKLNSGEIIVKDLTYDIDDTKILENISFSINDGEKIGLVGNIGSG